MSAPLTAQGTILGTFQYMAPEQVEGLDADARTDIFAFGAVLYEMLTGRKAFEGRSQASLIGAILEREPAPVASLQPATPASLDHVVQNVPGEGPGESLPQRARSARAVEMDSRPGLTSGASRSRPCLAADLEIVSSCGRRHSTRGRQDWGRGLEAQAGASATDQTVCDRAAGR